MVSLPAMQGVVAGAEGVSGAEQLQDMLAAFLSAVEASLEDGTLQAADAVPTSNAALEEQRVLLAQLQSEQDVLQSRLQAFEQVDFCLWSAYLPCIGESSMLRESCLSPYMVELPG